MASQKAEPSVSAAAVDVYLARADRVMCVTLHTPLSLEFARVHSNIIKHSCIQCTHGQKLKVVLA